MKQNIENLLHLTVATLQTSGQLPAIPSFIEVRTTKNLKHGDFASNIALVLAKTAQKKPKEVAEMVVAAVPPASFIHKIEIAGPGFINFFLTTEALFDVVKAILQQKENYGRCKIGREKKVLIEFVSSNPTGPLQVLHGRYAVFGDVVANLLDAVGFKVSRDYYVNDSGKKMDILTVSVWFAYLAITQSSIKIPKNCYQNDYVKTIAKAINEIEGNQFAIDAAEILPDLTIDYDEAIPIDALIALAKKYLKNKYDQIFNLILTMILADIREDLAEFGVHFDEWASERRFASKTLANQLLSRLKSSGHVYVKEDALWFRSTDFRDEKDRMLLAANGERTYFANDVAYHLNKFDRGFDIAVDIFGAEYQSYAPRMKAALQASEINPERLQVLILQNVNLIKNGRKQILTHDHAMTLRELRAEVGNDVARIFYIMRKCNEILNFDLDLAKRVCNENLFYYLQSVYMQIDRTFKQLASRQLSYDETNGLAHLNLLTEGSERRLLNTLSRYPDMIIHAAIHYEPYLLTNYLRELATDFHHFYDDETMNVEDSDLRDARFTLISAVKQIMLNGFYLLGINTSF